MRKYLFFTFTLILLFIMFFKNEEHFTNQVGDINEYYERLMNDFQTMFPDNNRNAGGAQFYHHIVTNLDPNIEEYKLYNSLYCGVSGSPVSPSRSNSFNYLVVKDLQNNLIYGKYYRCCWPCVCDIMKYVRTEQHTITLKDQDYTHYVLTINDPCVNESEIPNEISSFTCSNNLTSNGLHTSSGRLIIALLYEAEPYDETNSVMLEHHSNNEETCRVRNSQEPDELRGGMGDIFVRLSIVGNTIEPFDNQLLNIYGEPLHVCRDNESDVNGSWDQDGYCSEVGGGVHQLCFGVTDTTRDFAEDTSQGVNWSLDRVNKNHCMCLGAWALYKARQNNNTINQTINELKCESIPEMSLNQNYVDNWNTWNGNELSDQITDGVNSMVEQCYNEGNDQQKQYLRNKYFELTQHYPSFNNTEFYLLMQSER